MKAVTLILKLITLVLKHGNKVVYYPTAPDGEYDFVNSISFHKRNKQSEDTHHVDYEGFYIDE